METLCADTRSYMFSITRRILRCEEAAADATQDAMLLAYRYRAQFRGDAAYRTWLHRIAVTTALQHLRKRRRCREELVREPQSVLLDPSCPGPSPEEVVATRQLAARAQAVLAELGESYRGVFELRVEDHTETEIAARLGISVANVKIRAHRTRRMIRDRLREQQAVEPALAVA